MTGLSPGDVALYLAGLFGAYYGGLSWGVAVRFIKELGRAS